MKAIVFGIVLLLSVPGFSQVDSVLARYKRFIMQRTVAANWLETINAQGQWPDVDYKDTVKANWKTAYHLQHVRDLAILFNDPKSSLYHNARSAGVINRALDHWLQQRYKNSNWWHNQIGVPQYMRDIIILFRDSLTTDRFKQAMEVLGQYRISGTGANLTWSADLGFHYGALAGDTALMRHCMELIYKEIKISTDEGVQPDASFHQHGKRLQIYAYGEAFLKDNVRLAWEVHDTPWAFPKEKTEVLVNFLTYGWQFMARGIHTVPGTLDRSVSRPNALHNADVRDILPLLWELFPSRAADYLYLENRQNGEYVLNGQQRFDGFRYYPYSDFSAYHQPGFSFFLKTISTRTLPTESINSENLKGHLLNSGDAYIVQNGKEYFNLMPVWNWEFLPGITNVPGSDHVIRKPFVGSATSIRMGCTAMDYALAGRSGAPVLSAKKFWVCDNNMVVCLIAGMQSDSMPFTALDQSRQQSPVFVNKANRPVAYGNTMYKNTKWIYHNKTAYLFLQPSTVQLDLGPRTGDWFSINRSQSTAPVTDTVFMPVWQHEQQRSGGYVIAHVDNPKKAKKVFNKKRWTIVCNNDSCQAISFKNGDFAAVFYKAGTLRLSKRSTLVVDRPCIIIRSEIFVYASDPTHTGGGLIMTTGDYHRAMNLAADGTTLETN